MKWVVRSDEGLKRWRWVLRHLQQVDKALHEDGFCDAEDEGFDALNVQA